MGGDWYYLDGEVWRGPHTSDWLRQRLLSGEISESAPVRLEGLDGELTLANLAETRPSGTSAGPVRISQAPVATSSDSVSAGVSTPSGRQSAQVSGSVPSTSGRTAGAVTQRPVSHPAVRWIALLPGSIAASLVAGFAVSLFFWVGSSIRTPLSSPGEDAAWMNFLGSLAAPAVSAYALVWAAGVIAPTGRRVVSIAAGSLLVVLTLAVLVLGFLNGVVEGVLPSLAYCAGAVAGVLASDD